MGFLLEASQVYGGIVSFDKRTTIVNDPHLVRQVLSAHDDFVIQQDFLQQPIRRDQLDALTSRRHAINPGLRPNAVAPLGADVFRRTRLRLAEARRLAPSGFDPLPHLELVISTAVAQHFFGEDEGHAVPRMSGSLLDALSHVIGNPFALPASWPSPARRRVRLRHRELRAVVVELVERRLRRPGGYDDMASSVTGRLDVATHGSTGIADAIIGALLAAQRVPAASASWMLALVADHPDVQDRVRREFRDGPSEAGTACRQVDRPYARAVVLEAMRLYPATWILNRTAAREVTVGGYDFPAGHHFLMSPYVTHRDPAYFESPEEFRPDRWLGPHQAPIAYLPFGRGTHGCPGSSLATVVLLGVLAGATSEWQVGRTRHPVVPDPRTTLVPRGLELTLRDAGA